MKESLHKIPDNGIGYGLMQLKNPSLDSFNQPRVIFNYLGQIETEDSGDGFALLDPYGEVESVENEIEYPLVITGIINEGQLKISFAFSQAHFYSNTIQNWLDLYKNKLEDIIDFCSQKEFSEYTPSDFDYKDLSLDDLEELESIFE